LRRNKKGLENAVKALAGELGAEVAVQSYQPDRVTRYMVGLVVEDGGVEPLTGYLPVGEAYEAAWAMVHAVRAYKKLQEAGE